MLRHAGLLPLFSNCKSRQHCKPSISNARLHTKPLAVYESQYAIENILIVDNFPQQFIDNPENGIQVLDFEGDPTDDELLRLSAYLSTFDPQLAIRDQNVLVG